MKLPSRILASALLLTTVLTPVSPLATPGLASKVYAQEASFRDESSTAPWAREAVAQLKALGILQGEPDGSFHPAAPLTREEFAAILTRLLGLQPKTAGSSSYSDVPADRWSSSYVEAVSEAGYMNGDGGGIFRPESPLTREELAAVLVRALQADTKGFGSKLTVEDRGAVSSWALNAVGYLFDSGIMRGDDVRIEPQRSAERQEIAVMVYKALPLLQAAAGSAINQAADGQLVIEGAAYRVPESLSALFSESNRPALAGARIRFESNGPVITKITKLILTASGQAPAEGQPEFGGNLVLDAQGAVLTGDLAVTGDFVTIKNLEVTGSLELAQQVQHDFYADHLKVKGTTVLNGGDSHTVVFDSSVLGPVTVNKADVRVEPKGATTVGEITVNSNTVIDSDGSVTIPKLTVRDGASQVELNADISVLDVAGSNPLSLLGKGGIKQLTLSGPAPLELGMTGRIERLDIGNKEAKLGVKPGVKVDRLVLPEGSQASDFIGNFNEVSGQFGQVQIGANPPFYGGVSGPGPSGSGNRAPVAKSIAPKSLYRSQAPLVFKPEDLASDPENAALHIVTASSSNPNVAVAQLADGSLVVTPHASGSATIAVVLSDDVNTAMNTVSVQIMEAGLNAEVLYGDAFRAQQAGVEALLSLVSFDGNGAPVTSFDIPGLKISSGSQTLQKDRDYSVTLKGDGYAEVILPPSYLNTLGAGSLQLTLTVSGTSAQVALQVLEPNPAVIRQIQLLNGAQNVQEVRAVLESGEWPLILVPYSSLTEAGINTTAQAVLDGRGVGYTSLAEVQDVLDLAVNDYQNGNGALPAAIQAVNEAGSVDEMWTALSAPVLKLSHPFDLDVDEDFEYIHVAQYMLDHQDYADLASIQQAYAAIMDRLQSDYEHVLTDADWLEIGFAEGDFYNSVTQDVYLPFAGPKNQSSLVWFIDDPEIISYEGKVTRPAAEAALVHLTATLTYGYESYSIPVTLQVKPAQGLGLSVLQGQVFAAQSAGTETVIQAVYNDENGPVANLDLSNVQLLNLATGRTLINGQDYTVDEPADQFLLSMAYLNTLHPGSYRMSVTGVTYSGYGPFGANTTLYVAEWNEFMAAAVDRMNEAGDPQTVVSILDDESLPFQLIPFRSLSGVQRAQVAESLLAGRPAFGFTNLQQIQDLLDVEVQSIFTAGDLGSALAAVNSAQTVEDMLTALMSPHLHLDNVDYSSLEAHERVILAQNMLDSRGTGYADRDAVQAAFDEIINRIIYDYILIMDDYDAMDIQLAVGDSPESVTKDMILPTVGPLHGSAIIWTSSHPELLSPEGKVYRPAVDTQVTLTVHIERAYDWMDIDIPFTVKGIAGAGTTPK